MAYIPDSHRKYNLLPMCTEKGGEVFSYPSSLETKISAMLPEGVHVIPYGYKSYDDFDKELKSYLESYGSTNGKLNELGHLIVKYMEAVRKMNIKESWSVLRYLGETTSNTYGLTHGRYYYWPCSIENPEYEGVIDDEEFTSYSAYTVQDPIVSDDNKVIDGGAFIAFSDPKHIWEIAEDPTGMATRVLSGEVKTTGTKK